MKVASVAYAAALPLVSLFVTTGEAHPQIAALLPSAVARIVAATLLAFLVAVAAAELAARRSVLPSYRAGLVFGAVVMLASLLGFDPLPGIAASLGFMLLAVAGNAAARVAGEGEDGWRPIAAALLWSGIFFCGIALVAMLVRTPPDLYAFAHGRAIGIFENPNELALFALAVAAVGIGLALDAGPQRALGVAALAVATVTLVATGSRSGEVAYAIGALSLLASRRAGRGFVAVTLLVVLVGLAAAFGLDRRHNPAENDSRLAAWRAGVRTVALFPLTGVGVGAYYRVYPSVRAPDAPGPDDPIAFDPHDFYLSVAAEGGLLGLAAFGWCVAVFARESSRALAEASPAARRLTSALLAGLVAVACHLVFNGFALGIAIWTVLAALALGIARSGYGRVRA